MPGAMIVHGWALTAQGQGKGGIEEVKRGVDMYREMGAVQGIPYMLGMLVDAYRIGGEIENGLKTFAEALSAAESTGEFWFQAELFRLRGELLLMQDTPDLVQAEVSFRKSMQISHSQKAKSLELRSATSLARLLVTEEKKEDARKMLTDNYAWFTEGFDTQDLQEAKMLLNELSG